MKTEIKYICDGCGEKYAERDEALSCEASHDDHFTLAKFKFDPAPNGVSNWPHLITLQRASDNSTREYKRTAKDLDDERIGSEFDFEPNPVKKPRKR